MYSFGFQITSIGFIYVLCTWITIQASEFISLISSPKGDFCITNSSLAMYYTKTDDGIEKEGHVFLPSTTFSCNFENPNDACVTPFRAGKWELTNALVHMNTPIFDAQWELLPIRELPFKVGKKPKEKLVFQSLVELNDARNFKIIMSLKGEEAHILLCDKEQVEEANCYWFALQGWTQQYTALRRCTSGEISGLYPQGECKKRRGKRKHPEDFPLYMNNGSWSHVVIERIDRNLFLKVYKEGEEEVLIHYFENVEMFQLKYLLGHRKDNVVYCKVHDNNYMRTDTISTQIFEKWFSKEDDAFCVSLLVNTCHGCILQVFFLDGTHKSIFSQIIPATNGGWTYVKLMTRETGIHTHIKVAIQTLLEDGYEPRGQEFWSFDFIRECYVKEYRTTQIDNRKISECQLLSGQKVTQENAVEYVPDASCSTTPSIGRACIACSILKDRSSCEKLKICENEDGSNKCFCSPGYTGETCNDECPKGTYGYSCRYKCGFCVQEGKCNRMDGNCLCNYLFEGASCHTPKNDHYLRNSPKVISSKADSCEIQWDSNDYVGKTVPKYYLIQFADSKFRKPLWKDYKTVEEIPNIGEAMIENLNSGEIYLIRILISDQPDKIKDLNLLELPHSICRTACIGWKDDEVIMDTTPQSVTIKLTSPQKRCSVDSYKYELINKNGEKIKKGDMTSSKLYLEGLTLFTTYTIVLYSESQTIRKEFTTQEGVPSPVRNLEIEESTTSSIKLRWDKPQYANGEIQKYNIKYQRLQRVNCYPVTPQKYLEHNTTDTTIELNDLEPYTLYQVEIYAINRFQSSEVLKKEIQTQGLDYFKDDENLVGISITFETFERAASIKFRNVQCSELKGPLTFSIKFRCISTWCSTITENSQMLEASRQSFNIPNLQPYCEYKCEISFCRIQNNCIIWKNGTFSTKASAPSQLRDFSVISMGKNFISLRWLPPYPPTGMITGYRISTECTTCRVSYFRTTRYVGPQKCSIWPEYYCYRIADNVFDGYNHSVEVEAINQGNLVYTQVASIANVDVQERPPEKPYNLVAIWNLDNTMELFWNHPNKTNGNLKNFYIEVFYSEYLQLTLPVQRERLTYKYKFTRPFPSAVDVDIRLIAYNTLFSSEQARIKESSYPAKPDPTSLQISIENYTETTITISLNVTQYEINNAEVGQYAFVLIDDHSPNIKDPNLANLEILMNSTFDVSSELRIVAEINLKKHAKNVVKFTIGDGDVMKQNELLEVYTVNKPLQRARYYNITIVVINEYKGKHMYTSIIITALTDGDPDMTTPSSGKRGEEEEDSSGGSIFYVLLILLILIPIIVIGIIIKRKNIKFIRPTLSLEKILDFQTRIVYSTSRNEESVPMDVPETLVITHKPVMKVKPKLAIIKSTNPPNASTDIHSKPIKMGDFEEYVRTSLETGELEKQHELFPRGQTQPWQHGSSKINKTKNRYNNLVAYDHSRVILEKIAGDENSDYINANYIHGYNIERAYIATQGPKSTTLIDFWRMIWQENVRHIVMVANIYEAGKKKVEQYWPNINEELTFQDIIVQYQSMQLFANFEYRFFQVTKGVETRKIEQLHFTTWPDHGVPLYPQSLVPFLRKLLKIPLTSTNPIVVHCSAGVGRTGTIILADMSLRMASKEGKVDMLNNLQKLREQRPNMVDNVEQYKLAHLVVLESIMGLQTSIPCNDDMDEAVQRLIRNEDYKVQMNYLIETEWKDEAMESVAGITESLPNYPHKNRIQEIIPENQGRIFISRYPHDDESSSYINAVQVDGFRCPGRFLVTQQPLPNTVGDFWRFVAERNVNVIISINDIDRREKTSCKFWPTADEPEIQPVDFLLVKLGNITELEYYNIYLVHVWIKEKSKHNVQIVSFKSWPARAVLPSSCEEFLSFYEEAEAVSRGSNNVIVTCFDGATASGAYVALSFIIEQMKLEHECDVCLAVRTIRHNRKQFVTNEAQFIFLYDCAVKYINGFQPYANFQNK